MINPTVAIFGIIAITIMTLFFMYWSKPKTIVQQFFDIFKEAFIQWYGQKYDIKMYGTRPINIAELTHLRIPHEPDLKRYINILNTTTLNELDIILIGLTQKEYRYDQLMEILDIADDISRDKH